MDFDLLDEAYERLHRTGPEYRGWLSNHGPMTVEALARHGHGARIHRWLDAYLPRLDDLPGTRDAITDWRAALGDPARIGDWLAYFDRALEEQPWPEVLGRWWPRLLPGLAAGATHGVIRVGHAVRALRAGSTPTRLTELGQALAYWAARWQAIPGLPGVTTGQLGAAADLLDVATGLPGRAEVAVALAGIPRIDDQTGGIRDRLGRLPDLPDWPASVAALRPAHTPDEARKLLGELVHRAALDYLRFAHGEPVMLVHAVTAPTAVLRTLPALDPALWAPSLAAAWAATAAITAGYAPTVGTTPSVVPNTSPEEALHRAAEHGDAHVIKLADAVADVYLHTGDERVLGAVAHAARLV
ncbi:questin oxidase family protein [Micromonospora polyrhachis]|uniref:DUF4243 domain-containing protein n=1 Tax=Micromonospora polyrhachis TaxID=1282883 RepID=A0A7W7WPH2_9ACTN|nr:questin oxidase family protein [Micromonospora polyrhachis]MBB4959236.1 hypothetical protein [Micromonospora polyrhachis]